MDIEHIKTIAQLYQSPHSYFNLLPANVASIQLPIIIMAEHRRRCLELQTEYDGDIVYLLESTDADDIIYYCRHCLLQSHQLQTITNAINSCYENKTVALAHNIIIAIVQTLHSNFGTNLNLDHLIERIILGDHTNTLLPRLKAIIPDTFTPGFMHQTSLHAIAEGNIQVHLFLIGQYRETYSTFKLTRDSRKTLLNVIAEAIIHHQTDAVTAWLRTMRALLYANSAEIWEQLLRLPRIYVIKYIYDTGVMPITNEDKQKIIQRIDLHNSVKPKKVEYPTFLFDHSQ